MSDFGNINFNMNMGSYATEQEILKLKNKLNNLIMKLFNTHNLEEEISTNAEIKNQTEFLSSLLNIKRNELNLNNNMNNIQMQQMMQQQMMQQQMMEQQMQQMMQQQMIQAQQKAEMQNILNKNTEFTVFFRLSGTTGPASLPIYVKCKNEDKVFKIIERYRERSNDKDPSKKFIFNAWPLNPDLTAAEAGLQNNANIFVVATKGIRGG